MIKDISPELVNHWLENWGVAARVVLPTEEELRLRLEHARAQEREREEVRNRLGWAQLWEVAWVKKWWWTDDEHAQYLRDIRTAGIGRHDPVSPEDFGNFYAGMDLRLWHLGYPNNAFSGNASGNPHDVASARLVAGDPSGDPGGHVARTYANGDFLNGPIDDFGNGLASQASLDADRAKLRTLFDVPNNDFGSLVSIDSAFHVAMQHGHAHYHASSVLPENLPLAQPLAALDAELARIHDELHRANSGAVQLETWFHSNFCQQAAGVDENLEALHDAWHRILGVPEANFPGIPQGCGGQ